MGSPRLRTGSLLLNGILERILRVLDDFFDITRRLFGLGLNLLFQALRFLARISNQFPSLLLDFSSRILDGATKPSLCSEQVWQERPVRPCEFSIFQKN